MKLGPSLFGFKELLRDPLTSLSITLGCFAPFRDRQFQLLEITMFFQTLAQFLTLASHVLFTKW